METTMTHTRVRLHDLDGRLIAEGGFSDAAAHKWPWIVETIARELDAYEHEIDCEEPGDDDEQYLDYVTVRGIRVARIESRPYGHKDLVR
jgi:hypothetical protein